MSNEDEKRFKKVDGRAACITYVGEVQACSHRQQLQLMLGKLAIDPYFAYTDDHVQQHREHLRCVSVHHRNEGVRQIRCTEAEML